jgi:hypothetical protein
MVHYNSVLVYVNEALKELEGFDFDMVHFYWGNLPIPSTAAWQSFQAQM